MEFETKAVHIGSEADKETGAVIPPIHLSSTFKQEEVGKLKGYEYSRTGNPNRNALERQVAALENASNGIAFSSGSAATMTLQQLLNKGDHVICGDDVYGGTFRFYDKVMSRFGINYDFIDLTNTENVSEKITSNTKLIWLETPTNPLLKITNLKEVIQIAHDNNVLIAVDNTFATPYLQNPIDFGADFVVHSTTKYLGGHSDLIGGIILTNDNDYVEKLRFLQNANGAIPSPFDCWLLSRGIKTLALRMEKICANTAKVVEFLKKQNLVTKIYYPFLNSHPNNKIANKQMKLGGGIVSFDLPNEQMARNFLKQLEVFLIAESLGGVESLAEYPPSMTHGSIDKERRHEIGINDGLIRLSIGIEHVGDLINDLKQSFNSIS